MVISQTDALLFISGLLLTPFFIAIFQNNVRQPMGIIDFIMGDGDPNLRTERVGFMFLLPLFIGVIFGLVSDNHYWLAALSVALGALISVYPAFVNSKLLAPPLRTNLSISRKIYCVFVVSYGLLALAGSLLSSVLPVLVNPKSFESGLLTNLIYSILIGFIGIVINLYIKEKTKKDLGFANYWSNQEGVNIAHIQNVMNTEINKVVYPVLSEMALQNQLNSQELWEKVKEALDVQKSEIVSMIDLSINQELIRKKRNNYPRSSYSYARSHNLDFLNPSYFYDKGYTYSQDPFVYTYGTYIYNSGRIKRKYPGYFS